MKLKIGIDAGDYYPNSPINSGIKRIVNQVLLQLKSQHYKEVIPHIYSFKNRGLLFGSIRLPCYLYKNHDQIFWAFSGQIPWLTKFLPINKVLFLYDLGFYQYPQRFSYPQRLIQQTNQSVKLADKIIVSSQITKDQLIKQFPNINANKISVCYLGIDHLLSINIKSTSPLPYQYFLYVGVVKPLKNLEKLIQIYDQFLKQSPNKKIKLVIIGKAQSNYKNSLLQLINLLKQEQNIIFKDVVTDAELVNYYQHCIALLNVSLVEGFCFPVLGALSLGMSVIVNNLPIYKEYTPFFSNLYISKTKNDFIKKMVVICKNPEIKKQSINIPSQFTWKWYVQKLLENAL